MTRSALIALGTLFLIGGGIATMYAVSYHEFEPTSTGYIEYTVKPEAKALFAGALLFGAVLLLIAFTVEVEEDEPIRPERSHVVSRGPVLVEKKFCPFCGAKTVGGALFCHECGRGLTG